MRHAGDALDIPRDAEGNRHRDFAEQKDVFSNYQTVTSFLGKSVIRKTLNKY
jgi:hypothetical protein